VTTAFVQGIGVPELLIVLVIVLVIFGPKRLPMLGRQLGSGMREFKDSVTGRGKDDDDDDDEDDGSGRAEASAALGRPDEAAEDRPLEGEVVPERR
jgi:sec-independent protein translocase protein TatA